MIDDLEIEGRRIGCDHKPFVIAEMSGNHNQSLERALEITEVAARSGVDAVKLQTYTPDTMTLNLSNNEFLVGDSDNSPWSGRSLYDLYQEAYTPWEWHAAIIERANELGILCFSTPFDESSVEFLEGLQMPCYKIASFEVTDLPLLRRVAKTNKPLIISTGMASIAEINEAVDTVRKVGNNNIALLKCTSSYPAPPEDSNLATMNNMRELYNCQIGLSDHTLGIGLGVAAVALGATIIEKHITLRRSDGGIDSSFSLEPEEMTKLVVECERAWKGIGSIKYGPTASERESVQHRRSIYICSDLIKGDILTSKNIRCIRPGLGLLPKYMDDVLGRAVKYDIRRGTPLKWDMLV
jgi:pseudaminic acid synthase